MSTKRKLIHELNELVESDHQPDRPVTFVVYSNPDTGTIYAKGAAFITAPEIRSDLIFKHTHCKATAEQIAELANMVRYDLSRQPIVNKVKSIYPYHTTTGIVR